MAMKLDVNITQGSYWKGGQVPYWLYMCFVIFPLTGILGLDHVLLRSPITAILKVLSIIPLFGFWYFYDISQVLGERELVEKFGIGVPLYGPVGIGAGIFTGGKDAALSPPDIARPWRFIFYVMATSLFIVFPVNKIILGDYVGAFSQLIMYILFPLTFVAIGWGFYDAYTILFNTQSLFEKGAPRVPPASWLIAPYFRRSALGPLPDVKSDKPSSSWFSRLFTAAAEVPIAGFKVATNVVKATDAVTVGLVSTGAAGIKQVMTTGAAGIKQVMTTSADVADTALESSTDVIKTAANSSSDVIKTVANTSSDVIETTGDAAVKITALAAKIPEITEKMGTKLTDPSAMMKEAAKTSTIQHIGGSMVGGSMVSGAMVGGALSSDPSSTTSVVLFSVGLLAFGGYVLYSMRKTLSKTTEDDSPPEPRSVRGTSKARN